MLRLYTHIQQCITKIPVYPETISLLLFTLASNFLGPNKLYFLGLLVLILVLYRQSYNIPAALSLTYIGIIFFQRSRSFSMPFIPDSYHGFNYPPLSYTVEIAFSDVILAFLIYYLVSRKFRFTNTTTPPLMTVSLIGLVLLIAISAFYSPFPNVSTYYLIQMIKMVLLMFAALIVADIPKLTAKALQVIVALVGSNALLTLAQWVHQGPFGIELEDKSALYGWYAFENPGLYRPGGFYSDPNLAGSLFTLIIPYTVYRTVTGQSTTRWLWLLYLCLISLALIATSSRSAIILSAVLGIIVWAKLTPLPTIRKALQSTKAHAALILGTITLWLAFPQLPSRLITLTDAFDRFGGATYRLFHLETGVNLMKFNPLLGLGPGTFPFAQATFFPSHITGHAPNVAHNLIAQVTAELGFAGLLLFSLLILIPLKLLYRRRHSLPILIYLLTFASLILLMQFFPWLPNPKLHPWFWLLLAGVFVINKHYDKHPQI
jgi:O-antigen ligase